MTPMNIALWGSLYAPAADLVRETSLDPLDMAMSVLVLLVVPLVSACLLNARAA